jgi:hypothetical protein
MFAAATSVGRFWSSSASMGRLDALDALLRETELNGEDCIL